MQYTHKKRLALIRAIYMSLFVLALVAMNLGEGTIKTAFTVFSILAIIATVYLCIRYEMTTFIYIIKEKDTDFDFYVHKSIGRRGNYVCYYYMSDVVKIVKHSKEVRDEYIKKYKTAGVYSFYHNFTSNDKYIVIFKNTDDYDMIILEMNDGFYNYFDKCAKCADASCRTAGSENENENQSDATPDTTLAPEQEITIQEANVQKSNANESQNNRVGS